MSLCRVRSSNREFSSSVHYFYLVNEFLEHIKNKDDRIESLKSHNADTQTQLEENINPNVEGEVEAASGRCSSVVEARLLRYWETRNIKRGGELMWVDLLMVDVNSGRCSSVVEARLLRYWKTMNIKHGGELMWVDMLMVDVNTPESLLGCPPRIPAHQFGPSTVDTCPPVLNAAIHLIGYHIGLSCSSVVEARLLRYWETRNIKRGGELMWVDMLMVDVNATMMQATISANRLPQLQERLTAGAMYSISGFDVSRSAQNFRLTDSSLLIRSNESTTFDELAERVSTFPEEGFRFRNQSKLLDIIGEIVCIKSTISDPPEEKNRVMVTINWIDEISGVDGEDGVTNIVYKEIFKDVRTAQCDGFIALRFTGYN
ncbi:hypothetical protein DY000_02033728 [Brassica cretica]|uniref:START domain-containing protein n=1 Tax=Brassica cretica TaxID=69181 RepID=A0ABQ7DN95_BRACR|nr:hypothetical protein DY000_02033728 [Brassica cretica]